MGAAAQQNHMTLTVTKYYESFHVEIHQQHDLALRWMSSLYYIVVEL